jgi:hypothetical protein
VIWLHLIVDAGQVTTTTGWLQQLGSLDAGTLSAAGTGGV